MPGSPKRNTKKKTMAQRNAERMRKIAEEKGFLAPAAPRASKPQSPKEKPSSKPASKGGSRSRTASRRTRRSRSRGVRSALPPPASTGSFATYFGSK